ncbi:hypothetical protein FOA43_000844 [Brettanomyces nanus]|uniref:Origin recognition complex subunit 3 n=1 Tax=Eeniella nana TaxID=13502 RepID=A0A875RY67_EENNA|nr:uncharacterized protein FOA43_000844 [Brettanomyces nanus]QPG73533.1 hypothetical protein FOA43_000844 [Brettanomyces nanus]
MSFNDFIDSQKIIYELKKDVEESDYPYDCKTLYYQEGVPTRQTDIPFVRLLQGKEPISNMKRRYKLYKKNWSRQLSVINEILANTDREKFEELGRFLYEHNEEGDDDRCELMPCWHLPCGLVNLGSNISNHRRLLNQVYDFLVMSDGQSNGQTVVSRLNTAVCSSISACLKTISFDIIGSFGKSINQKLPDLEDLILQLSKKQQRLVVLIEDADSLPTSTLTQLLKTLWHCSTVSHNVYVVIGISTPLIIFQEKIPRLVLNFLRTRHFRIDNSNEAIGQIMGNLLLNINDTYNSLIFEPRLILYFLQRKSDIGISQFYDYMKLIYMNHYFSQPLSILWTDDFSGIDLTDDYFDVFKRLPSVRAVNDHTTDHQENDDCQRFLHDVATENETGIGWFLRLNLNKLINWRFNLKNLIDFLNFMQTSFYDLKLWRTNLDLFQLIFENYDYENVHNNVANFDFLKPIYLNMKNIELSVFNSFLDTIQSDQQFDFLFQKGDNAADTYFQSLKHAESHKEVEKFNRYLNEKLIHQLVELNLDHQPFKEICCAGLQVTGLLQTAFNPPVRDITIGALLDSKSYLLNSAHSDLSQLDRQGDDVQLYKLFEPSMIEMFRIYREAGVMINIYDFYKVFRSGLSDKKRLCQLMLNKLEVKRQRTKEDNVNMDTLQGIIEGDSEKEWDKLTLSWFLKGLVELELAGMIKEGRNSENVEKLVWKDV